MPGVLPNLWRLFEQCVYADAHTEMDYHMSSCHLLDASDDIDYHTKECMHFLCGIPANKVGINGWEFLDSLTRFLERNNNPNKHWCEKCLNNLPAKHQMMILSLVEI